MTAVVLTLLVGIWAVISGILEFAVTFRFHRAHGEGLEAVNGILSVLFGVLLFFLPAMGVVTLVWLIRGYAIFFGVLRLASAFCLNGRQSAPA